MRRISNARVVQAQRELFRRPPRPPVLDPDEREMQIAVMQHYKLRRLPGVIGWHTPNGELREKSIAAKLKAMGVMPGVADLMFVFPKVAQLVAAPVLFLELKVRGETLSPNQEIFRDLMRAAGHTYEMADSIDEALRILKLHKVIR